MVRRKNQCALRQRDVSDRNESGRTIAWHGNGSTRYLLGDHLSSTHGELDTSGNDVAQHRYFPFGGDRAAERSCGARSGAGGQK